MLVGSGPLQRGMPLEWLGVVIPELDPITGKLDPSVLPPLAITDVFTAASEAAMLALAAQQGDICRRTDITETFILAGSDPTVLANWKKFLITDTFLNGADTPASYTGAAGDPLVVNGTPDAVIFESRGTAFNKAFGTGSTNVPQIGGTLGTSKIVETDFTGKLITASKRTAYNKDFGSTGGKVVEIAPLGLAANNVVITDPTGKLLTNAMKTAFNSDFGVLAGQTCEGNDSRLSDARTPLAHKDSHDPEDGSDPLDTAAPGSISEAANATGTSHSLARADHNHQHLAALHENGGGAQINVAGLFGVLADDQHIIDTEAVTAMGAKADGNPLNHDRYTDAEAGTVADGKITTHTGISGAHHSRYIDSEAVSAMGSIANSNPLNHNRPADVSCYAKQSINQVIRTGSWTPIVLDSELFDTDSFHKTANEDNGTATGVQSATTLQDTSKTWGVNAYVNAVVRITGGTGIGQARKITGNTVDTLTVSTWDTTPDATSTYEISLNSRITIPVGKDGQYLVMPRVTFSGNATGIRGVAIYKNGVFVVNAFFNPIGTVESTAALPSYPMNLVSTDYIEMYTYHSVGAPLALIASGERVYLSVIAQRGVN